MADPNSPFQPMDTSTMFDGLVGGMGKLPGKTAAARLNYLQDMMKSMGDPFKSDPAKPIVQADPSLNRSIYDSNPVLKSGMDLIDQNTDPVSAFEAIKKANPTDASGKDIWTDPTTGKPSQNATDVQKVLHDYAFETKQNALDASKANAKNAKPPGVFDVANAYDLSNQPTVDDLLNQLVDSKALARGPAGHGGGPGANATPMDYATWAKQQPVPQPAKTSTLGAIGGLAQNVANNVTPGATGNAVTDMLSGVKGLMHMPLTVDQGIKGKYNGPTKGTPGAVGSDPTSKAAYAQYVAAEQAKAAAANAAAPQYINGSMMDNNNARIAANNWIRNAKATTIHSDTYNKAVQTALAMRAMMGS